jgi:hypothetical protein
MRTSKETKEKAETCGTPDVQIEMQPARLLLSPIDANIRLAQVLPMEGWDQIAGQPSTGCKRTLYEGILPILTTMALHFRVNAPSVDLRAFQ